MHSGLVFAKNDDRFDVFCNFMPPMTKYGEESDELVKERRYCREILDIFIKFTRSTDLTVAQLLND